MEVILAKTAGMCAGVLRALKMVEKESAGLCPNGLCTYGPLIHNKIVIDGLEKRGVFAIDHLNDWNGRKVALRAHGVPPEIYAALAEKEIPYIDCTCIDVKKNQQIAHKSREEGRAVLVAGDKGHPEVIGVMGFAGENAAVVENEEDVARLDRTRPYALLAQTTFSEEKFARIAEFMKNGGFDVRIYHTVCLATANRQREAGELSKTVDYMIVLGDKQSSNTTKLYEICKKNCKNTFLLETISELQLNIFCDDVRIGITAGASTPPEIIEEAFNKMSELSGNGNNQNNQAGNQSFEEMLNESFITLHTGNVVKGTVINVSNGEVFVNLRYKSDGIIPRGEFSEDPAEDPANVVSPGDEIEVFVIRVNDGDGNVLLSKKKVDAQKNFDELETAFNNGEALPGRVIDIVKGGLIALINGVRVFVPSSQIAARYVEDLTQFKGKEFNFNILEFDKAKRRFVAGRKALALQEQKEKKEKVFETLEVGKQVEGTVSRIVDFGAFVDLGGVDGLIHISELSWGRVKKVKDILSEGDHVVVTVLELDKAKGKISLSLKNIQDDPWTKVAEKYPVGSVVTGKVVRMVPFGAFVELEPGVDGLVHISQIASKHVVKPEDELKIGQIVEAKVTETNLEAKRISLSMKELEVAEETQTESLEEDAPVGEGTEE